MRILITNTMLADWTGSELYVRDIARALRARGHEPMLLCARPGALATELLRDGFVVVDDPARLPAVPELIHGQHHIETMLALDAFPGVPAVFVCHGAIPWEEAPPRHPRILRYVAISDALADHLVLRGGVPSDRVTVIPNFVDLDRFRPREPVAERPQRALVFGNRCREDNYLPQIRDACARRGIAIEARGLGVGHVWTAPERHLGDFDVVFAVGRSALEAMAVGAAVVLCQVEGLGPMVTRDNFHALRRLNFGIAALDQPLNLERLNEQLDRYDAQAVADLRRLVREQCGMAAAVDALCTVYREAIECAVAPSDSITDEGGARRAYLRWLGRSIPREVGTRLEDHTRRIQAEKARLHDEITRLRGELDRVSEERDALRTSLGLQLTRALGWVPGVRLLHKASRRTAGAGSASKHPVDRSPRPDPEAGQDEAPAMACVVLCLDGQPEVVEAVRSLHRQSPAAEIVVVNSDGNNPRDRLHAAGLSVPVVHFDARLYPGGARNVGIACTSAPYVAFLAADCVAEPGWVAGRLAHHRAGALLVSSAVVNGGPDRLAAWAAHLLLYSRRMPETPPSQRLDYGVSYARTVFDRIGTFREDLRTGEDTVFNAGALALSPIHWAPEVRTAHRHPATLGRLLVDQYHRGARMAHIQSELHGRPFGRGVAANAVRRWLPSLRLGLAALERRLAPARIAGVVAVSWLGMVAYALGALRPGSAPTDPPPATVSLPARRRVYALCAFHNEAAYLPGLLANLEGKVDGLLALDDGSTDGSAAIVAAHPLTVTLLRKPPRTPHHWDEPANQRALIEAAWRTDAQWLIAVDADERLEHGFRQRAEAAFLQADAHGHCAYYIRCCELWNQADTWRVDGIWSRKKVARLFRSMTDHEFDTRQWHRHWAPLNGVTNDAFPRLDIRLYHLRMLHADDRARRRDRYLALDPQRMGQAIGYEYLTDEDGLQLERIAPERDYRPGVQSSG